MQARFVDSPGAAVGEADRLVIAVLRERGYPMDDFDQRAADISVDHADVVENYRAAQEKRRRQRGKCRRDPRRTPSHRVYLPGAVTERIGSGA